MRSLRWPDVWRQRLRQHSLVEPAAPDQLADVARRLCGVHAQVQPSAELSLAARVDGLSQALVRQALWHDRTLVRTYGPRGTVHLFAADDLPVWLAALRARTSPRPPNLEELRTLPPERAPEVLQAMHDALDGRCLTRSEMAAALQQRLGAWVTEEVFPAFGGYLPRWQLALSRAANAGVLVFGPPRGNQVTYVRRDQWLPAQPEVDGATALRELFLRYLSSYGPATHVEFGRWLLIHPDHARQVQAELSDCLEKVEVDGWPAFQPRDLPTAETPMPAHLLPQFDSYIVGCHPREQLIPPAAAERLGRRDTAAPFSVVLVDGAVGGLWSRRRSGRRLVITVDAFSPLTARQREDIARCAERLAAFSGLGLELSFDRVHARGHL